MERNHENLGFPPIKLIPIYSFACSQWQRQWPMGMGEGRVTHFLFKRNITKKNNNSSSRNKIVFEALWRSLDKLSSSYLAFSLALHMNN